MVHACRRHVTSPWQVRGRPQLPSSFLDLLLLAEGGVPAALRKELHALYFELIRDAEFKQARPPRGACMHATPCHACDACIFDMQAT